MKRKGTKKYILQLPKNYGEVLILTEIKFNTGDRSIKLIRELLHIYSIGMEYYDSINNNVLYTYYSQKNVGMLTDPAVLSILDDENPKIDLVTDIKLFQEDNKLYKLVTEEINEDRSHDLRKNGKSTKSSMLSFASADHNRDKSVTITSPTHFYPKDVLKNKINSELDKLKSYIDKINDSIEHEKSSQENSFHLRRLKKLELISSKSKKNSIKRFVKRRGSKIEDIIIAAVSQGNFEGMEQSRILQSIYELSEKKLESNQAIMMKEMDEYIDKCMIEMNMGLEELRLSFEDEIKGLDSDIFPDVVNALKEDMDFELSNLRDHYEDSRRDGVEKIRAKYFKKK